MNGFKECSSCGALYTKLCGCSKGGFVDKVVCNKTPYSSQQPPPDCLKYGNRVDGLYCRHCAISGEREFFQDFLNTYESSNDNTNIVSAPQEPIIFNQHPGKNSSQSPPQIDHHCCYGCGDPLDAWDRVSKIKATFGNKQYKPEDMQKLFRKLFNDVQNIHEELAEYINTPSWNRHAFSNYDDDDDKDYAIAITPEEPNNSLSIRDEHPDAILAMESDEVIKSSIEDLVLIPSESEEEVKDDNLLEKMLNINLLIAKIKSLNDNPTPDHVLKSPSPFPIPAEDSDSFLKKSDTSLSYSDNSLPEFETFSDHMEETNSGSTTTHADYSLPKYDLFLFEIEPGQGELTSVVMEDNLGEPRVHVPNVLPTHPTPMLDSDFIPFDNSLPESEIFYFDIEEKNSGSTTIHVDISLLDLEYFNFKSEPDPGELTSIVDSRIRENVLSVTNVNLPPEEDHLPLVTYVVWIFLSFLTYPVVPPYLLSSGNEDTTFDPGISNYYFSSLEQDVSHQSGTFMKFNVYQNDLNESPMEISSSTC
nr:hypothetical protein [Tanacetum cinerariifolium]